MAKAKDSDGNNRVIVDRLHRNLVRFVGESGYNQNQVADLAGIPQANFGRYYRGENALPAEYLKPLADVFGRLVGDFYEVDPPPPPSDLGLMRPVFLRARPGVSLTEEDFADFEEFLQRVKVRRSKKSRPR